jgi:integrase/recombinase XerD
MDTSLLREFQLDWQLTGKAHRTARDYAAAVLSLLKDFPEPTLADVKQWIASTSSQTTQRKRGQAIRAVGKWAEELHYEVFVSWRQVPLIKETTKPQTTVTEVDYRKALRAAYTARDVALIEVLWSTGLRRSEIERLQVADVNLADNFLLVRTSKTGKPRVVPLSPQARHALRRYLKGQESGSVFQMTSNAIRLCLQRLGAPSAHAWRRGWAVQALRAGVSEASVKAVAGWSSGAMVSRYTSALSGELAIHEFHYRWAFK